MSPFGVICFKFPFGSGVAKPVVSYSKVKIFQLLFKEYDDRMPHIRQALFGVQFADLICFI